MSAPKNLQALLYSGSTLNNFTLSDSAANYTKLKIYYHDNNNRKSSVEIETPNGSSTILETSKYYDIEIYRKYREISISGTAVTNVSSYEFAEKAGTITSVNNIYVDKVIGFTY